MINLLEFEYNDIRSELSSLNLWKRDAWGEEIPLSRPALAKLVNRISEIVDRHNAREVLTSLRAAIKRDSEAAIGGPQ